MKKKLYELSLHVNKVIIQYCRILSFAFLRLTPSVNMFPTLNVRANISKHSSQKVIKNPQFGMIFLNNP